MKILIAEDHKVIRDCFKTLLDKYDKFKVVGCASNGMEAYNLCKINKPDLVLMDLFMPTCNGIDATKLIKDHFPSVKILILTSSNNSSDMMEAIKNGADGYILKDVGTEELILSIESIINGLGIIQREFLDSIGEKKMEYKKKETSKEIEINGITVSLSNRQLEIIRQIVEGHDNKEISKNLYLAEGTVKNIVSDIISKLQLKDRTQLAVYAIRNHLLD